MTYVSERSEAARQPWSAGAGKTTRKRTVTYADAGVSIDAGEQAVELLKSKVSRTWRSEVVGDLGDIVHAAAQKYDFASVFVGEIHDLLQTMNGGTEAGNHQAARRPDE